MKEQYVGDISDYRKYALLRALGDGGRHRIGVCWMLTPPDGRTDGNKLGYLSLPERYRHFDPEVFDILAAAASEPDRRRLLTIEESGIIPGAVYFNDMLGDRRAERAAYFDRCFAAFEDVELVFFDPDNGMEIKLPKGRKNSSKFVYMDELARFYEAGKSLLVYQHFPFIKRPVFIASCAERLTAIAPGAALWSFRTAHVVFLLAVHPDHRDGLGMTAARAAEALPPTFIKGLSLVPAPESVTHPVAEAERQAAGT